MVTSIGLGEVGGGRGRSECGDPPEDAGRTPWEKDDGTPTHRLSSGDQSLVGPGRASLLALMSGLGAGCGVGRVGAGVGLGGVAMLPGSRERRNFPPGKV